MTKSDVFAKNDVFDVFDVFDKNGLFQKKCFFHRMITGDFGTGFAEIAKVPFSSKSDFFAKMTILTKSAFFSKLQKRDSYTGVRASVEMGKTRKTLFLGHFSLHMTVF